jgi:Rrf2 family transcriptional regulator, cysteine metabolism repressor
MLELSSRGTYALLAVFELALAYEVGEPLQIKELASRQNIPDRYLEQLLATLRRRGLVKSQRGARGGYLLSRSPSVISIWEIMETIEGEECEQTSPTESTLELSLIREVWTKATCQVEKTLRTITLKDLCENRSLRQATLMYYI